MNPRLKPYLPAAVAFLAGALAYLAFGHDPERVVADEAGAAEWQLPEPAQRDVAAAATTWQRRAPWGKATPDPAATAQAPAVQPVGVVAVGGEWVALFLQPGGAVARVSEGGALADGGRVDRIGADTVAWTDGAGNARENKLLEGVVDAPAASAPERGSRAGARGNRAVERARTNRPAQAAREQGQRRARTSVPNRETNRGDRSGWPSNPEG